jgi:hypothetical protein
MPSSPSSFKEANMNSLRVHEEPSPPVDIGPSVATRRKSKAQTHRVEIIGSILLLVISAALPFLGISKDVAWFAAIMSVLLGLTVAVIKDYVSETVESLMRERLSIEKRLTKTVGLLSEMDGIPYRHGVATMDRAVRDLERIKNGEIPLSPSEYFQELVACMNNAPDGSIVYAVNCMDELRWIEDPRQMRYFRENLEAASRGARISRIFIIERRQLMDPENSRRLEIVKIQLENENIEASVVWRETLVDENDRIQDWVYFSKPEPKLYIDYPDRVDGTRIAHAVLVVNSEMISRYLDDFEVLMRYRISKEEFFSQIGEAEGQADISIE